LNNAPLTTSYRLEDRARWMTANNRRSMLRTADSRHSPCRMISTTDRFGSLLRIQPKPGMTGDGAAADDAK
jgi:hypothetical protein